MLFLKMKSIKLITKSRRIKVKNFIKILLIAGGVIFFVNTNSYAIVDISAYGGYTFSGTVDGGDDFKAVQYGAKAHYNTSIIPLLEMGLGLYYQQSKIKYENSFSFDVDATRQSIGLDLNLILALPIIHPYGRFTYAFWDMIEADSHEDKENFKAWGAGLGVEFTVIPFFRIFGEYMYDVTDHSGKSKSNMVNLGVKFDF